MTATSASLTSDEPDETIDDDRMARRHCRNSLADRQRIARMLDIGRGLKAEEDRATIGPARDGPEGEPSGGQGLDSGRGTAT